jgi:peptidyl-prolyl cis-trans isomerase C
MKTSVLSIVFAVALCAQTPKGPITADTVVANIGGKDVTAGDLEKSMRNWSPGQVKQFYANPLPTLKTMYTYRYLAAEGEKMKLGDEEPWKSQIEYAREGIMGTAMTNYIRNNFPVSEQDSQTYYNAHKSKYEQARIKVIMLGFQEPIPVGTSISDTQQAAQVVVQNQHAKNKRSEKEALALAAEIVKQAKAGTDFVTLVKKYSDDDSKSSDGDYGTVGVSSSYPEEMKKAVLALKTGDVSDPVRQPNALYIVRVESREAVPLDKVRVEIINEIRDEHLHDFGVDLGKKFEPKIIRPEFFLPGEDPQAKKP